MMATTQPTTIVRTNPTPYIVAIAGCGVVTAAGSALAGAICDAVVLLFVLTVYTLSRNDAPQTALPALVLIPLVGLIGFSIPVSGVSRTLHDGLVAVLLLQAVWLASRLRSARLEALRLHHGDVRAQLAIAVCGVPLGVVGERILHPHPLAPSGDPAAMAVAILVLGLLVAPSLELTFRWLVQDQLALEYGPYGILWTNFLFAGMYLSTGSAAYIGLIALTGLGLSVAVQRTGCVWGAVAAHALMMIGVLVVWPAVLG